MIRRPPRSTPLYSSAASDVYKRQDFLAAISIRQLHHWIQVSSSIRQYRRLQSCLLYTSPSTRPSQDLVCRLLLEKKKHADIEISRSRDLARNDRPFYH